MTHQTCLLGKHLRTRCRKQAAGLGLPYLLQDRSKHWLRIEAPVVPEGILVQVGLEILSADRMINTADTPFHQTPKALNRVCVRIFHDVDFRAVIDAVMSVSIDLV